MTTPNVESNELLFRQVSPGGNPIYFDPTRRPPVHQANFLPSNKDIDGLSLICGRFRTEVWIGFRAEQPEVRFRVVKLQEDQLRQLALKHGFQDLSYSSSPDGLDEKFGVPWAHCVAIEINRTDYDKDLTCKKRIKEWAMAVARLIEDEDVLGPFVEPTSEDPYRPVPKGS